MSEGQFKIQSALTESSTAKLRVQVAQVSPEEKPGFYSAELTYGDMSSESVADLKEIWAAFQSRVAKLAAPDANGVITGSYDDLMCVQLLSHQLVGMLCNKGFEYAKKKGIAIPKAETLRSRLDK